MLVEIAASFHIKEVKGSMNTLSLHFGINSALDITTLKIERFIRKMRVGIQSFLAQCTNGQYVVIKLLGNPQGRNVLPNELMGGFISRAAGIPVPKNCFVHVSDEFIARHPNIWFETTDGLSWPPGGIHFGSLQRSYGHFPIRSARQAKFASKLKAQWGILALSPFSSLCRMCKLQILRH